MLPLLLMLVAGGIDWGYYFWASLVATNAAREGARAGSLEDGDNVAAQQADATAQSYLSRGGLDPGKAAIQVTVSVESIRVTVTYPTGPLMGFAEVIVPTETHAHSEMRRY